MKTHDRVTICSALFFLAAVAASLGSSAAAEYRMSTKIPPGIAMPETVETRLAR